MLTVIINQKTGDRWFIAAEVCACIGVKNARQAIKNAQLDPEDQAVIPNDGRKIVSELGAIELIGNGRKKEAKQFRKKFFKEILPALHQKAHETKLISRHSSTIWGAAMARIVINEGG